MQPIDEGDANRLMSLIDAALASGSPVTEIAMDHDGTPCRLVLASGVGISWVRGLLGEPATEPKPEPQLLGNPLELPEPRASSEDKAKVIRKAWYASSAWTIGGTRCFKQRHPNLDAYLKQELG